MTAVGREGIGEDNSPPQGHLAAELALRIAEPTALGVLGDREAAADVAQEVAITALERVHTLRDGDALDRRLHRVAVRAALKHARRDRSRREAELASGAGRGVTEPAVDDGGLGGALALLDGLPPRQRAALALRYVHDLPDAAIARALGCRRATVRKLLSRGRHALRERLAEESKSRTRSEEEQCR